MKKETECRYSFAKTLAKEAGKIALDFYVQRENLQIECKKGEKLDLVSIADQTVEKKIKQAIDTTFPEDGFLGEETGAEFTDSEFCWVVDPIDGTNPFLYGLNAWCISIALLHKKNIVVGVIFDPVHNELFHASLGNGAYLNDKPIHTSPVRSIKEGLTGLGTSHRSPPHHFIPVMEGLLLDGGIFVRNGSGALTLAYVASGRLIGYFEPHINAWDVCAGLLLIKEAGGVSNNFLEKEGLTNGNYILACCNDAIFSQLNQYRNLNN